MSIKKIARAGGVETIRCPKCDHEIDNDSTLRAFVDGIIKLVKTGGRVTIHGLGTFKMLKYKGRESPTPLMKAGKLSFKDLWVLKFSQSAKAREILNE